MLRELISWVLNTYLGKYLEDFNPQQLSVALLSGKVELENVPLRKNALRELGIPMQIQSGCVGKIQLQVPVRSFRTAPWCIVIERLYVVIGPKNIDDWNEENEKQYNLENKLIRLDEAEAKLRAQKDVNIENSSYASSYSGWLSYGSGLVANIIENLQINIIDVCIRYEDTITIPNNPFACGITIESLSAQSCDINSEWESNTGLFKLVELHAFSLYWDRLTSETTFGKCIASALPAAVLGSCLDKIHHYIIKPISANAHFKQDRSEAPLKTKSRPRLFCKVIVNEIHLKLTDFQYKQVIESVRGLEKIAKLHAYRLLRPSSSIQSNPRKWWQYAARCHGYKLNGTSVDKLKKSGDNIRYIKIYSKLLVNPNENLSNEEKQFKNQIEICRDLDELKFLREICFAGCPNTPNIQDLKVRNQNRSMLFQWFPSWSGWYGSASVSPSPSIDTFNVSENHLEDTILEDEILNVLDEKNMIEKNTWLKRDVVFAKLDFSLISGELNICREDYNTRATVTVIALHFDQLKLNVETRPRSNSHTIELSLGSVYVRDLLTKNTEFPELVKPQNKENNFNYFSRFSGQRTNATQTQKKNSNENLISTEPWFQLQYERKPLTFNTDYRLVIKTKSLDVVYNVSAMNWLTDFFASPLQVPSAKLKLEEMKYSTKMRLMKNWQNILEGEMGQRKSWSLEIDISAPQIIFVEDFCNINTTIVILDFGRFKLLKNANKDRQPIKSSDTTFSPDNTGNKNNNEKDEEETFMTPCSTPPGSQASASESPTICTNLEINPELIVNKNTGLERAFYDKIYDKYTIDLTDLQVLVCKSKERWNFSSSKGSSALHVLDRFSITLQLEMRNIYTIDPEYPSLTLYGTLPKLIAHVSEHKISALTNILKINSNTNNTVLCSTTADDLTTFKEENSLFHENRQFLDGNTGTRSKIEHQKNIGDQSTLIILQFVIDQLSLEVQSRGRSIAELQVTGVRTGLSKSSPNEINVSLSVHGLLLVDAIQSFGPDFELLVASHRHVGMDSVSGSLKQSKPCSPIYAGSPDPMQNVRPTSPQAIARAISSLERDALITVTMNFINPDGDSDRLQIANINFNNLDIIANQETIVELLGFINRVFPKKKENSKFLKEQQRPKSKIQEMTTVPSSLTTIRTEITFDFRRLNVLVLRALMRDTLLVGRKVGTLTLSEAKINAVLVSGQELSVEGSLGGLQILDLTPEGVNHQRIVSIGKDPLTESPSDLMTSQDLLSSLTQEIYGSNQNTKEKEEVKHKQALSFKITRDINAVVSIQIRMGSVWYTHCARFTQELNWCATEFKHYIKNFARSIREKATDIAYGLVQPINTPGDDMSNNSNYKQNQKYPNKLESPSNLKQDTLKKVTIKLDILLDTPVLVVPRSSYSAQVLVAHLGKIIISNHEEYVPVPFPYHCSDQQDVFTIAEDEELSKSEISLANFNEKNRPSTTCEIYSVEVKNVNLFSLDTSLRKGFSLSALPRAENFYSCQTDAVAILFDTAIRLKISRYIDTPEISTSEFSLENKIYIEASVTQTLQISLSRNQYEQVLETFDNIFKVPSDLMRPPKDSVSTSELSILEEQQETSSPFDIEVQRINEKFTFSKVEKTKFLKIKVTFSLPIFVIRLKNEHDNPLIEINFREFSVQYEKDHDYESKLQVSLRSIHMEDLLCSIESKFRQMVISSSDDSRSYRNANAGLSSSCPDLVKLQSNEDIDLTGSLPENLNSNAGFDDILNSRCSLNDRGSLSIFNNHRRKSRLISQSSTCPETPPPSPQPKPIEDNLVIYSTLFVDPNCSQFKSRYNSMLQRSSIEFNCLSLIISVERWFVLLDFFGLLSDDQRDAYKTEQPHMAREVPSQGNTELEIAVRSLNLTLIRDELELAKVNVSSAFLVASKLDQLKVVEGKLGSVSLYDLTQFGRIYTERFLTSGSEALKFIYKRDGEKHNQRTLNKDAKLSITMSSVRYVHTNRFITEIQEFFKDFLQLQSSVLKKIKSTESKHVLSHQRPTQLGIEINAGSPIILLPLSFESNQVIIADLGEFTLKNSFHLASEKDVVISKKTHSSNLLDEILDVMQVDLVNTNLFTGVRIAKKSNPDNIYKQMLKIGKNNNSCLDMGSYWINKETKSLLKEKCHLKLQIERNMDSWKSHNCPEISIQGTLSRLEFVLHLEQYKLIRGFLAYNLGEQIDDVYASRPAFSLAESRIHLNLSETIEKICIDKIVWTTMSVNLDLEDVLVVLEWTPDELSDTLKTPASLTNLECKEHSLACINFIKSCLKIDSYSDESQDIDLVSQEILITDTRFGYNKHAPLYQKNVFTDILQPTGVELNSNTVQAELHSRKRNDNIKYTILLNNMRLMAIIDWIENIKDYICQNYDGPSSNSPNLRKNWNSGVAGSQANLIDKSPFELIVNITDSELVFVEKTDQVDTNAVILKSTTVLCYKPFDNIKPMSINLNHLEVFSCILGHEEETALSIIDPITVNLDLINNQIEIQMHKQLCIRLSYHDVKMFTRMLQSLPQQTRTAQKYSTPVINNASRISTGLTNNVNLSGKENLVSKLKMFGFKEADCISALEICNNQLTEAANWLTKNRRATNEMENSYVFEIHAVLINAQCISIVVIDDCKDADVPLLEVSLSQLNFRQELNKYIFPGQISPCYDLAKKTGLCAGHLNAVIASDYYNRNLSGWEAIIEPWECSSSWNYSMGTNKETNRLNLSINSEKLLKLNVTCTLIELWQLVRNNWTQDYYEGLSPQNISLSSSSQLLSPTSFRRRAPFVPYSLKNHTGSDLWFKILLAQPGGITRTEVTSSVDSKGNEWLKAEPNETIPFSFGSQNKLRHLDSHKLNLHQILVAVKGWSKVGPVSVDKVGVFFRITHRNSNEFPQLPKCRIVFAVTLEGSAQKLVTVRSSLQVHNSLQDTIMLKMEHNSGTYPDLLNWPQAKTTFIQKGENFSVPLGHVHAALYFKPICALMSAADDKDRVRTKNSSIIYNDPQTKNEQQGSSSENDLNNTQHLRGFNSNMNIGRYFQFCDKSIHWRDSQGEISTEQRVCRGNQDKYYYILCSIRRDVYQHNEVLGLPGHTINILPPLRIYNLLCCDLMYKVSNNCQGVLRPSQIGNIPEINLEEPIQLNISLDGYKVSGQLIIPAGHLGTVEPKLRLTDINNRILHLNASIQAHKGNGIEIYISAPYWLVNKTGLPLIFRQEGCGHPASGQFEENENARLVTPLMFSFSDADASPALEVRLGNRYGDSSPWCQGFSLQKEIIHRQLKASHSNENFIIGVEVRRGKGRYSRTSVVTLSPRFQLYNRSSHELQFSQKCFIENPADPDSKIKIIQSVPGCHFPFHWPRCDHEPLLCVRLADIEFCCWSAGIPINDAQSLYINCRNDLGDMFFLRLEVILQGATYFLLFGDANALPPPIRVDNFSEVPISFFQYGSKPERRTSVKPQSSVSYALDDPMSSQCLQIEAPDGDSYVYSLRDLNVSNVLTYSNFIYIAFSGTFATSSISDNLFMSSEVELMESQHLVLGVRNKRVMLMRHCVGDRSQLWLMNSNGQLEHEGSSPPTEPGKVSASNPRHVLDLERAPNPMHYTCLVVRPANKQRESTQTWKFVNNRLMCGHANMSVQTRDGLFGLRAGSDAVLGRIESDSWTRSHEDQNVPIEQAIERQKLRPGSGHLKVTIRMDGPIKSVQIRDVQKAIDGHLHPDPLWKHASHISSNFTQNNDAILFSGHRESNFIDEFYIKVKLTQGLGISVITRRPCEELAYTTLEKVFIEAVATPYIRSIDLSVGDMQIDNQLLETPCPILLYTPKTYPYDLQYSHSPYALEFQAKMLPSPNENAVIYERVVLGLKPFILYLEEKLILRSACFFGFGETQYSAKSLAEESECEAQQLTSKFLASNAKRYYFEDLQIRPSQVRLSVITASKLSPQLSKIKKKLGLTLIKFEDAVIDFEQFTDRHHFETLDIYMRAMKTHYKNLLKWQAASILISVDFLGNPMGLANDLSEGVSGLLFEGSVKSLVKNVTHGISNSTAKLTETISDGLGRAILDEEDNDTRQKILEVPSGSNSSGEHLAAGLKGFGFGLLGGVTSMVKYTYEGAQADGFGGFLKGVGKGIVGTVTKPIIGVLDLASETANAVRETSKSSHRILPKRKRLPRCLSGAPGGLIPLYSFTQSKGQQILYIINKRNFAEQLMSYEPILFDDHESKLRLLVSTEYVRIFSRSEEETTIILQFHLSEVLSCHPVTVYKTPDNHKLKKFQFYVEISSSLPTQYKRPRVRCQTEELAEKVSRQINYAKEVFDEREHSLSYDNILD